MSHALLNVKLWFNERIDEIDCKETRGGGVEEGGERKTISVKSSNIIFKPVVQPYVLL